MRRKIWQESDTPGYESWRLCVVFYNWLFLATNFRTLKRSREASSQMQPGAILVGSPFLVQNSLSSLGLRYWGSRVESELIRTTFCMLYCPIAILAPAWIFLNRQETSYRLRTTNHLHYPTPLCRGALSKHLLSSLSSSPSPQHPSKPPRLCLCCSFRQGC